MKLKNKKSIEYIAHCIPEGSIGVQNKIKYTIHALNNLNYKAYSTLIEGKRLRGIFGIIKSLVTSKADTVIYRSHLVWNVFFLPFFLFLRLKGKKIVIDIPTPSLSALYEITSSEIKGVGKVIRVLLSLLGNPFICWVAHRIIQYGSESSYFLLGCRKKTVFMGNGVNVNFLPEKKEAHSIQNNKIVLIGVAHISKWHAFDRLIKGIASYKRTNHFINVEFRVVGDGPEINFLKKLVSDLNLIENVLFTGRLTGKILDGNFDEANIAVSSLGLHRKHLSLASSLKSREYVSRGLPFIMNGSDPDFNSKLNFVKYESYDDTPIDILELLIWYEKFIDENKKGALREYALTHLDFSKKVSVYDMEYV